MATVSTSEGFAGPNGAEQLVAVAQLVLTATEFAGVTGVQIMVAGGFGPGADQPWGTDDRSGGTSRLRRPACHLTRTARQPYLTSS